MDKEEGKEVFGNTFLWVFSFVFQQILRFLIVFFIVKFFGKSVFGGYSIFLTFVAFFSLISRHGWEYGFIKFIQEYIVKRDLLRLRGLIKSGYFLSFILSILISTILFFKRDFFISTFFKHKYFSFFYLSLFFIPIHTLLQLSLFFIEGLKKSGIRAILERGGITLFHILIFLLIYKMGSITTVLSFFIASTLFLFVSIFFISKYLRSYNIVDKILSGPFRWDVRKHLKYNLNLFSEAFINFLINRMDILFLAYFVVLGDVGVYSLATRFAMMLTIFYFGFESILTPKVSEFFTRGDLKSIRKLYIEVTWWGLGFTLPLAILYFVLGKDLLNLFGRGFEKGVIALFILTISKIINVSVGSAGNLIAVCGHPKLSFYNSILVAFVSVILNILLIPHYGIIGVSIATGFSLVLLSFLRWAELLFIFKFQPFGVDHLYLIFAGAISFLTGYISKSIFNGILLRIVFVTIFIFISYTVVFYLTMSEESKDFIVDFLRLNKK